MSDWYTVNNASDIDTPALLIYQDRVKENIRIVKQVVPDTNRLRPHVKTNKCAEVCALMMEAGIKKFKCATIAEAEMLAALHAPDVLLAYQPVGPRVKRLIDLIKKYPQVKFSCLLDTASAANELSTAAARQGVEVFVYIDLNVGMNRTGIEPEKAFPLVELILSLPSLQLNGLHAYDGHLRDPDLAVRTHQCNAGFARVEKLANELRKHVTHEISVIAGGTPSFPIHAKRSNVECSPGTFIFWDKGYQQILTEQPFLFGALVMTRIVSLPTDETITTDLGHKAIASENPLNNRVFFLNAPELQPKGHSEEHLVLSAPKNHSFQVGDVLYGVPYHVCPTVALHETAQVVTDNQVTDQWTIVSRKRKITI